MGLVYLPTFMLICMLNVGKYIIHGSYGNSKMVVLIEFDVIKSGSMWLGVHHFLFLMGACAWFKFQYFPIDS